MANYKQKTLTTEHMPDIQIGGGNSGGESPLPQRCGVYSIKDVYNFSMVNGGTVAQIAVYTPVMGVSSISLDKNQDVHVVTKNGVSILTNYNGIMQLFLHGTKPGTAPVDPEKPFIKEKLSDFFLAVYVSE